MEAGADLEQAPDPAPEVDAARRRGGDARQDLQQRALAGAVAADHAEHLARLTSKSTSRSAQNVSTRGAVERVSQALEGHLGERDLLLLVADRVGLAEPLDADGDVR